MPLSTNDFLKNSASRCVAALPVRHSFRRYDAGHPVPADLIGRLKSACNDFHPFDSARVELITSAPGNIFRGILGSYNKVTGASLVLAVMGDTDKSDYQVQAGYTGEGIILEATSFGLQTCWVSGFFNPKITAGLLTLNKNERVLAVSPVGYASENGKVPRHKRFPIERLVQGTGGHELNGWMKTAIESARLAPSAVNHQPWDFIARPDGITIRVRTIEPEMGASTRLDCGIAMLHLEAAAFNQGVGGSWEFLKPPEVARFVASAGTR